MVLATIFLFSFSGARAVTLLSESFDGGVQPAGWSQVYVLGSTNWIFNAVGGYLGYPSGTHSGAYNARIYYSGYGVKTNLITPSLNFTGNPIGTLTFWHTQANWAGDQDSLVVLYRTAPADPWKMLAKYTSNITAWTTESISLPNLSSTYQIAFRGCAYYGYGVCLDDVLVTGTSAPPVPPVPIIVGTGTSTVNHPYNTFWMGARTHELYEASEIIAAGGSSGSITQIGFNVYSYSTQPMLNFTVQMQNTSLTTLPTTFTSTGWTTCFNGTYAVPGTGWQMVTLQTPFTWDGTSNLLVNICYGSNGYWTSASYVYGGGPANHMTYQYSDYVNGCTFTSGYNGTRANIRMMMTPPSGLVTGVVSNSYNGTPIVGATVSYPPSYSVTTLAGGVYYMNVPSNQVVNVTASATGFLPKTLPVTVGTGGTATLNFALDPVPAILSGVVTNCATGAPVVGAKVWVSPTKYTYSIAGGAYSLPVYPGGTYTPRAVKAGFEEFVNPGTVTLTPPNTTTLNICLLENVNPPGWMTAALNPAQTQVDLNWSLPWGSYLRIYDDGTQENFTIWAAEGNMNAVKFTGLGYPCRVTGFHINIGRESNYVVGSNPLVPFQAAVYDATGPGGKPGSMIGGPYDVIPTAFGWNEFVFPEQIDIPSGDFYIVQIQGGNAPDAAGCAIDTSSQQLRSYQRFVTGGGPWVLASGNFMIRALMLGTGGPILTKGVQPVTVTGGPVPGAIYANTPSIHSGTEGAGRVVFLQNPESINFYQYWRLKQLEEGNPAVWVSVGTTTGLSGIDNSWPTLPDGAYRWAVKTNYTGNRWSPPTFSNVIGKNWTAAVTINVTLSCDSADINNTTLLLQNVNLPDTNYTYNFTGSGPTGSVSFPAVWKGNYTVIVSKWGYVTSNQPATIMGPTTIDLFLLQEKTAPTGLYVDDRSLLSTWNQPKKMQNAFNETFAGGLTPNAWQTEGNWTWTTGFGNPSPSAVYPYYPEQFNYSHSLTSKVLSGVHSPALYLMWDVFLDNFGNTTLEQLAVELWNGTSWLPLANYDNSSGGNIPWTTGVADISPMTNSDFQVRFRAYGEDTFYIDAWYVDNVKVVASDAPGKNPCVLGYNYYLNSVLLAFVPDTFYTIPPAQVTYGQVYTSCVEAVYGSGYSSQNCFTFTSHFLCPPTGLTAEGIEDVAYLTWVKPSCLGGTMMDFCWDDGTWENGWSINPGYIAWLGNYMPVDPALSGVIKSFDFYFFQYGSSSAQTVTVDVYDGTGTTLLGSSDPFVTGNAVWMNVTVPDIPFTGPFYGMVKYNSLPAIANYLGEDTDGPNAYMDLAYIYDGTSWTPFSAYGSTGVFMECVHVLAQGEKQERIYTVGTQRAPSAPKPVPASLAVSNTSGTAGPKPEYVPEAPMADPLLGYNVYRDEVFIAYVAGPNTLEYYDLGLDPGDYCYEVTGYYDLTTYGFPGDFDESLPAGPACVNINYGYEMPFCETWDQASFTYNEWTFDPAQGNWSITTAIGNPLPSADFSWQPMITNYDYALVSPTINASGWTCAEIWLDLDVKLVDRNATSEEFLVVEVYYSNNWFEKLELTNNGSFDWTTQHIDISGVKGKAFQIRIRAEGANSADILHWYVDNICAYGVCNPPTELAATQSQFTTTLTWTEPVCGGGGTIMQFIFDDGTWENGWRINPGFVVSLGNEFPIASTLIGVLQSFDLYFVDNGTGSPLDLSIDVYDGTQTLVGSTDMFTAAPYDEWITVAAPDIPFAGLFYAMVLWNGVSGNSYYLGDDEDGPYSADNLYWMYDGSSWTHPSGTPAVFLLRATALVGADLKQVELTPTSMRPVGGVNANNSVLSSAGTSGDSGDHSTMGVLDGGNADSTTVVGYNIYRTDETGTGPFSMLNGSPVTATTYTDTYPSTLEAGTFLYYVTAVMNNSALGTLICEPASDTIEVTFPAVGIEDLASHGVVLYPNPSNDVVNVVSTATIRSIEVLNYIGQVVYTNKSIDTKKMQLHVSTLQAGVYFVKVTTDQGLKTVKITVTH
jgi:hypothetical protein